MLILLHNDGKKATRNYAYLAVFHNFYLLVVRNFWLAFIRFSYYIILVKLNMGIAERRQYMIYPNIAAERARRGLTTEQLAKKLGVCRKTLYNWEHSGNIPMKKVEAMARLFNVSADYLLSKGTE